MKISIIIPVYNVKNYINNCLKSLINQTYKDIEVILVDDGSNDGSELICDECCKKYNFFKVIHKINGGVSSARNEGLKYATGEYIIFVDSDDIISTDLCERIIKIATEYKPDVIQYDFCKFNKVNEALIFNKKISEEKIDCIIGIEEIYKSYFIDEKIKRELWAKAYKKELLKNLKFPEDRLAEDLATMYIILSKCNKIICINDHLYYYRVRNNSIMGSGSIKLYYDAMLAHYEIFEFIKDNQKYFKIAYTNYFNNLMKLYAKNVVERHDYETKNIEKRYDNIKFSNLKAKGKFIFILSKMNLKMTLKFVYNLFIKGGRKK